MSYDIRFGVKVAGSEDCYAVIGEPEYHSPTYNVTAIFRKSMDWDYQQSTWYSVNEIIPKVEKGIHELRFNADAYRQYEPDNGYGSVESALKALESIIKWITEDLAWSWNGDIPRDCLYMSW